MVDYTGSASFTGTGTLAAPLSLVNTAEGGTAGTQLTALSQTGAAGSGNGFSQRGWGANTVWKWQTGAAHGSLCYEASNTLAGSSETSSVTWGVGGPGVTAKVYLKITAVPSSVQRFIDLRNASASMMRVQINTTGTITAANSAGATVWTSTNALPLNTWVRIEAYVAPGTGTTDGTLGLGYATLDQSLTEQFTSTAANTGTTPAAFVVYGKTVASTWTDTFWLDTFRAIDGRVGFIGPELPAFTGAADTTGSGALAATATPAATQAAGLTGSGTLAASITRLTAAVTAALGGPGALTCVTSATQGGATYRMYASASPPTAAASDAASISLGVQFYVTASATLTEIRWWQATTNSPSTATRQGALYLASNQSQVAVATAAAPTGTGWQTLTFATPVALTANTRYEAVVYHPGGQYANTVSYYTSGADETNGPLVIPKVANTTGGHQGGYTYATGITYPASSYNDSSYWVDVTVTTGGGGQAVTTGAALTGSGALSATSSASTAAAPTQTGYRGRNDDGTEAAATWKAALNTGWTQATGATFRVRFALSAAATSSDWQLMYSRNGGAWTPVSGSSTVVRSALSPNIAENDATTQQISTGAFYAGTVTESDGYWGTTTFTTAGAVELEASLTLVATDVASGDSIQLRVAAGNWADLTGGYAQTPTITAAVPGVASGALTGSGTLAATPKPNLTASAALSGAGSLVATSHLPITAPTQTGFRGRNDDGDQATATWKTPLNVSWTQPLDTTFRARFEVTAPAGASTDWQLMYSRNGGAWTPVTGTSTVVQSALSPNVGENDATTQQLYGGGTYYPGAVTEVDGYWTATTFTQAGVTELEASVKILSSDAANGDTIQLRVATGTWASLGGGYARVPTVTVGIPGGPATAAFTGAGRLAVSTSGRPPTTSDDFESYPVGTWADGSTHGQWLQEWSGVGVVQILSTGTSKAIQLESAINPSQNSGWGDTASSLVTSEPNRYGDIDFTVDMRTLVQLRTLRSPPTTPNAWEVAWIGWNYRRISPTTLRYYYVTLKPGAVGTAGTGFELGKVDQSIALPGGQRFFVTDSSTSYPVGTTWHTVRIRQIGARIQVWADGDLKADFTDGPGSSGSPAWGATVGETVFTDGGIALYQEDSRAQFDNLAISGETSPGIPPAPGGTTTGGSLHLRGGAAITLRAGETLRGGIVASAPPALTTPGNLSGSGALAAFAAQGGAPVLPAAKAYEILSGAWVKMTVTRL